MREKETHFHRVYDGVRVGKKRNPCGSYAFRFPVDTNVKVTLGVEVEALFLAIEIASTKPSIELDSVLIEDIY